MSCRSYLEVSRKYKFVEIKVNDRSYECMSVSISNASQFVSIDFVSSYLKDETCNRFDFMKCL